MGKLYCRDVLKIIALSLQRLLTVHKEMAVVMVGAKKNVDVPFVDDFLRWFPSLVPHFWSSLTGPRLTGLPFTPDARCRASATRLLNPDTRCETSVTPLLRLDACDTT